MALTTHERGSKRTDMLDRFLGSWPDVFRRPVMVWPAAMTDFLAVEEFQEDGTTVIRAELAGIDPEKDVEITVSDGVLRIEAQRREEEEHKARDYVRKELRYGSFRRDVPLPAGCTEEDVKATYRDGILEVRLPTAQPEPAAEPKKIPVEKG